jgi:hypothetical protein
MISDVQNKSLLSSHINDSPLKQCYLNLSGDMVEDNPSAFGSEEYEKKTTPWWKTHAVTVKYPEWYSWKTINNVEDILCYTKPGNNPANWKIALPEDLIKPPIKWYHQINGHPESKRLYGQLWQRCYHRDLHQMVDNLNCDFCQRNKLDGKGYGFLPEHEVKSILFEEYAKDLIGPWTVQVCGRPYQFEAITVIDTVTNLVELVRIKKWFRSCHVKICAMLPNTLSLATTLYTWSRRRIHRTSVSNLITELSHQRCVHYSQKFSIWYHVQKMHQTVGNVLRTLLHGEPPQDMASAKEYINEALSIAMHAIRAAIHSTLASSPGSLTFDKDMFINIPMIADWHTITQTQKHLVNEHLIRENQKCCQYNYVP